MHPFSESMGSVVRVRELAFSLGKAGVEVYIFTPYERSFDLFPNVHVISASSLINNMGVSNSLYRVTRGLYYTRVFPKLFRKADFQKNWILARLIRGIAKSIVDMEIDIIQVEQDAAVPIGIGLKHATGLPLIADVHNISSEELVANRVLCRNSDEFCELQVGTKKSLSQADHIIVVSESMKSYAISNYGLNSSCVSVVPPGGRLRVGDSFVKQLETPKKVVYAGLVAYREHVDLFVKSIPSVSKNNQTAKFYITNKGEAINDIKLLAHRLVVKPEFFWYSDYSDFNKFLSSCTVGILPSSNDIARRMGTPVKLFSYLAAGLPVIANDIGGWSRMIKDNNVGVITSDDPTEFGEAISNLIQNPSKMAQYSQNCRDLIKNEYNWDNSAKKLMSVYENIIT